jgi:predicted transcriptional regulator of viral defense system
VRYPVVLLDEGGGDAGLARDDLEEPLETTSGYIPVSTPEMTAYDLIRFRKGGSSIDHVATVLSELAERMDAKRLLTIAKKGETMPLVQRLGYLLDLTEHGEHAEPLHKLVEEAKPKFIPLEPQSSETVAERKPDGARRARSTSRTSTR